MTTAVARTARLAVAALVLAGAAACGSDDDTAGGTTTTTPATTATPATAAPTSTPTPSATTAPPTFPNPVTTAPGVAVGEPRPDQGADGPAGEAFYAPPEPMPPGPPGSVIWSRPLEGVPDGTTGRLVLYRSTTATGAPAAVSGVVLWPSGAPPVASRPLVTIAHGTTGLADQCAPSRLLEAGQTTELGLLAAGALARGWAVVATDYEGLGTPGVHPYLVGQAAGHDVLDAARMAARFGESGVDASSPVVVFGHSQGGGASAFAAELAPSYAPDLDVRGAVAGAPATELASVRGIPLPAPVLGFGMMIIAGFEAAYPDLPTDAVLTAAGQAELPAVEQGCAGAVLDHFSAADPTALLASADAPGGDQWDTTLTTNTAGATRTGVPVYVFHGDADLTVPVGWSQAYQARACAAGTNVARTVYPGADHTSVLLPAIGPAVEWLDQRLAGVPAPPGCP